jgi:tetratricopeptide (TPR) repeat protein
MIDKQKLDDIIKWIGIFTGVVGFVTAIYGVFFWVDIRISNVVQEKIEPYEHLLNAKRLVDDKKYDEAIHEFEDAFDKFDPNKLPEPMLAALIEPYLFSIANAPNPTEHHPDFEKIFPYIKKGIPLYGWHYHQLGLYFLRTNRLKEAENYLSQAREKYYESENDELLADIFWVLSMLSLCKGDLEKAILYTDKAAEKDSERYAHFKIRSEQTNIKNDPLNKRLFKICEGFGKIMDEWFEVINERLIPTTNTYDSNLEDNS